MDNQGVIYDGVKAFSLRELSDTGWTIQGSDDSDIQQLYQDTAWLYAVIQKRAGGVASIPRVLMRGETEVEEDDLDFDFDISDLLWRSSIAVDLYAKAYLLQVKNQFKPLHVRWFNPESVTPIIDEVLGLERFERQAGTVKYLYDYDPKTDTSPDGLVWIWQSGMDEVGPGTPKADVAAGPAMLLRAIDSLGIKYFSQGAIGQIYFTTETPMQPDQRSKFKQWWDRMWGRGLDTSYNSAMVLSKGFEPHKLSADPKDLMMPELDEDNRRDISAIYDTPEALVTGVADGMSRATLQTITSSWINGTIMQQASLIVGAFNHHILEPAGYELVLNPDSMTVNQEDERQRALAFSMYRNAKMPAESAAYLLGLELPDGMEFEEEGPPLGMNPPGMTSMEDDEPDEEPEDDEEPEEKAIEVERCRQFYSTSIMLQNNPGKASKKTKQRLERDFHSDILTLLEIQAIKYQEVGKVEDAPFWKSYP